MSFFRATTSRSLSSPSKWATLLSMLANPAGYARRIVHLVVVLALICGVLPFAVFGTADLVLAAGPPPAALDLGGENSCVLINGGVKCWGYNVFGQIGDNTTTTPRETAVSVLTAPNTPLSNITAIALGYSHACALNSSGGVLCWGYNAFGQIGDNTTTQRTTATPVSGLSSGIIAITAGENHTCALNSSGGVLCWGYNGLGQLGDNTTTQRNTPTPVSGLASGITAITAGYGHTCALNSGGGMLCWGDNTYGQLGDNTTTQRNTPTPVSGLASGITAMTAGQYHTCALISSGGVLCWGYNGYGQLGDGTTLQRTTATSVSGLSSGVTAVAAGENHTCALNSSGGILCWGYNGFGQLGDNTTTQRTTPTPVSGLASGVTAVSNGRYHTCAITNGGIVRCWGYNGQGELGNGTTTQSLIPYGVSSIASLLAAVGPGGVTNNLRFWSKADSGVYSDAGTTLVSNAGSVQQWNNQADSGIQNITSATGTKPLYYNTTAANLLNFNPALAFSKNGDLANAARLYANTSGWQGFSVGKDLRAQPLSSSLSVATMGLGLVGNYPAFDMQTGVGSPNGWNPRIDTSSPASWGTSTAKLYNGNTGGTNVQPQLFSLGSGNLSGGTDNVLSSIDGFNETSTLDSGQQTGFGSGLYVGSSFDSASYWNGLIGEIIVYDRQLSATEIQQVNSYLAIKYGVTLDQTAAQDYLTSDGITKAWDATANATYKQNITAIGRDDLSGLNQKQAKSVNANGLVTIGLGTIAATNAANSNTFASNKNFEIFGDDNGSISAFTAVAAPANDTRLARVWKVQETGTVGTLQISVPDSTSTATPKLPTYAAGQILLLVDDDGDFTSAAARIPLTLNATTKNWEGTVNFSNGQFFTFSNDFTPPSIVSVTSTATNGTYGGGAAINLTVNLSEPAATGSSLALTLDTGAVVTLSCASGLCSSLSGNYTVAAGQNSSDLTVSSVTGTLTDSVGNASSSPSIPAGQNLGNNKNLVIDAILPAITSISSTTPNGSYNAGDTINLTVNLSKPVATGSSLALTLDTGAIVTLSCTSGPCSSLSGNYTVATGQTSSDLTVSSLSGSLTDSASNNNASPSIPAGQNLGDNKNLVIDTTLPTLTAISSTTPNGSYNSVRAGGDGVEPIADLGHRRGRHAELCQRAVQQPEWQLHCGGGPEFERPDGVQCDWHAHRQRGQCQQRPKYSGWAEPGR